MAFSVSYTYEIIDRYTTPARKIARITKLITTRAEKARRAYVDLGKAMKRTGHVMRRTQMIAPTTGAAFGAGRGASAIAATGTQAKRTAATISSRLNPSLAAAGQGMANLGTMAGGAGAILALKSLIGTAYDFNYALNHVEAVTQSTAAQMAALRKQAMDLGRTTQFSASQAAGAMSFLGMAGLKFVDILNVMPGMLDLAAAGSLQLADAADISTNVLSAYGLKVEEIGKVSDMLAAAASNSNSTIYDFAEAMKNVGPMARAAGISLKDTIKYLMTLSTSAIRGGEAGTLLMNAFRISAAFSKQGIKLLKRYGINFREFIDETGKLKDYDRLLDLVGKKKVPVGALFKIFDIRGGKAVAVLKEQTEQLKKFDEVLKNAEGRSKEMADTMMKGLPGAIKKFLSAMEGLEITMSDFVVPTFTRVTEVIAKFTSHLAANHPKLLKFSAWMITAAAIAGALIIPLGLIAIALGGIGSVLTAITGPMWIIIGAVGLVTAAFSYWAASGHPVIAAVKDLGIAIYNFFQPSLELISFWLRKAGGSGEIFRDVMFFIGAELMAVIKLVEAFIRTITMMVRVIGTVGDVIGAVFTGNFAGALQALRAGGKGVLTDLANIDKTMGQAFRAAILDVEMAKAGAKATTNIQGQITVAADKGTTVRAAKITAGDQNLGINVFGAGLVPGGA